MDISKDDLKALLARLKKRADIDRSCAVNNTIVADLLKPQVDRFEERVGHNVYAVRMAIDHRNSAKKDNQYADDLEKVIELLEVFNEGTMNAM